MSTPTTTFPAFQPSGFATSQFNYPILLNDLNSNDRSFLKELIRKYGAENYGLWQLLMGRTATYQMTDNKQFYHYEKRELHSSLTIGDTQSTGTPGASYTFTVAADSYYVNGACAARVNETGVLASNQSVALYISAIPSTTANAWTVTITPENSTDIVASAGGTGSGQLLAGDAFLFRGIMDIGEASTTSSGLAPVYDKIYNTTTEHRDDFTMTDFSLIEKQEVVLADGRQYYKYLAQDDMNRRYMNNMFFKVLEANGASNRSANGTFGTIGVQPRVAANGSTVQYVAGNPTISDFHTLGRALNFFGAPGEYHMLMDFYSYQSLSDMLFTTYKNTFLAATYESFDGDGKEAAAAYGFSSFKEDGITYHFIKNPLYNPEMVYKRQTNASTGSSYNNYSLLIPQRINQDPKMQSVTYPSFQIVWQTDPNMQMQRIYTWDYGGAATNNKTGQLQATVSMSSYFGVRVIASVQYALFIGI